MWTAGCRTGQWVGVEETAIECEWCCCVGLVRHGAVEVRWGLDLALDPDLDLHPTKDLDLDLNLDVDRDLDLRLNLDLDLRLDLDPDSRP